MLVNKQPHPWYTQTKQQVVVPKYIVQNKKVVCRGMGNVERMGWNGLGGGEN